MATTNKTTDDHPVLGERSGLWGALIGLIVAALIAAPLSGAVAFATHPLARTLFDGRLGQTSAAGFSTFWWVVALLLAALPFLVGFGIARLSVKTIGVICAIVAVFVIAIVVLGQLFLF
ncbi:hypothetical protein [Microbacterium elymi]|uniref:Uncharacterized protein n=1 Tax=Microbacterium elymi TaxID=2909587 RepID=A0ABY5NIE7_9MICO|nr:MULTISPECIES: hypothetical protein [Microbacterium]UUT34937.1 hypothetical protein L2X98_31620 [Microbacterium elymi]